MLQDNPPLSGIFLTCATMMHLASKLLLDNSMCPKTDPSRFFFRTSSFGHFLRPCKIRITPLENEDNYLIRGLSGGYPGVIRDNLPPHRLSGGLSGGLSGSLLRWFIPPICTTPKALGQPPWVCSSAPPPLPTCTTPKALSQFNCLGCTCSTGKGQGVQCIGDTKQRKANICIHIHILVLPSCVVIPLSACGG